MSNFNSITEFTKRFMLDRERVIDKCLNNYAEHLGCSVVALTVSHGIQYYPTVTKLVNQEGVVIFEVHDPEFKFSCDDYNTKNVSASFKYKEFWKDE